MKLLSSNIKKKSGNRTPPPRLKKKILYISGHKNAEKASSVSGNGTFQSTLRKFLILQQAEVPTKFMIFSQKKAFLIFWKWETLKKFFIFQETKLSYISGNPKKLSETKK